MASQRDTVISWEYNISWIIEENYSEYLERNEEGLFSLPFELRGLKSVVWRIQLYGDHCISLHFERFGRDRRPEDINIKYELAFLVDGEIRNSEEDVDVIFARKYERILPRILEIGDLPEGNLRVRCRIWVGEPIILDPFPVYWNVVLIHIETSFINEEYWIEAFHRIDGDGYATSGDDEEDVLWRRRRIDFWIHTLLDRRREEEHIIFWSIENYEYWGSRQRVLVSPLFTLRGLNGVEWELKLYGNHSISLRLRRFEWGIRELVRIGLEIRYELAILGEYGRILHSVEGVFERGDGYMPFRRLLNLRLDSYLAEGRLSVRCKIWVGIREVENPIIIRPITIESSINDENEIAHHRFIENEEHSVFFDDVHDFAGEDVEDVHDFAGEDVEDVHDFAGEDVEDMHDFAREDVEDIQFWMEAFLS